MTYEEAIKRLRQETCPATYNKDFDKEACIRAVEERVRKQDEVLRILKKHARKIAEFPGQEKEPDIQITIMPEADEEYLAIIDWLDGRNKQFANFIAINEGNVRTIEKAEDGLLFQMAETLATAKVKSIDEYIIKQLYEAYKGTEVSRVFVIGMDEFEEFLKKMLPLWMEGRK